MVEKLYTSACGASITEAHYWRNTAKELLVQFSKETAQAQGKLGKKRGMTKAEKERRLQEAQEHVAAASMYCSLASECLDRSLAAIRAPKKLTSDDPVAHSLTPDAMARKLAQDRLTVLSLVTSL